jgi:hypothetical protein
MTAKEQVISSLEMWIDDKVDSMTSSHPRMSVLSPRLKQGFKNLVARNEKNIENTLLFFTDKDGKLDVGDVFEEAMKSFADMPVTRKSVMGMDIAIGKGEIVATLPQNVFTDFLFGGTGAFKFTADDFLDLKELLTVKNV